MDPSLKYSRLDNNNSQKDPLRIGESGIANCLTGSARDVGDRGANGRGLALRKRAGNEEYSVPEVRNGNN